MGGASGSAIPEAFLVHAMWSYASSVLGPAQALKRRGLLTTNRIGDAILPPPAPGLGPRFSREFSRPVLMGRTSSNDHLVEEFDRMAEIYDAYVERFSRPIFEEALREMAPFIRPDTRALDAGCGAGRELQQVAWRVPAGEVVGIDLAAGMVNAAFRSARSHGLTNCGFFQSDVSELPSSFDGAFDLVYSSLAHHHYPDPPAATAAILRVLRPGGVYCVVDPGLAWFNAMSSPLAKWADPGWIGFHTPEQFQSLFRNAGFVRCAWVDLLPGFGLAMGQK